MRNCCQSLKENAMEIRFVDRDDFYVCGYSVETTLEENDKDIAALLQSYFHDGKSEQIDEIAKNKGPEYYGLSWYTKPHERYRYLLGKEVVSPQTIPVGAEMKLVPKTHYAVGSFDQGTDIIQAWTDFFYSAVPGLGYAPNFEHGFWSEYYPDGLQGRYELWIPVVKANV